MSRLARCRSCDSPIVWAITANDKRMPVDVDPVEVRNGFQLVDPDGAIVEFDGLEEVADDEDLRAVYVKAAPGQRLYTSHFATCPKAAQWRR
jgi:hypothetical protein